MINLNRLLDNNHLPLEKAHAFFKHFEIKKIALCLNNDLERAIYHEQMPLSASAPSGMTPQEVLQCLRYAVFLDRCGTNIFGVPILDKNIALSPGVFNQQMSLLLKNGFFNISNVAQPKREWILIQSLSAEDLFEEWNLRHRMI